jgi:hypothetical protein
MRVPNRRRLRPGVAPGFTTLESLVALLLIVFVVALTGRVIVTTLTLVGRGTTDEQHGARLRSQATVWIQGVSEYTRRLGFPALVAACATVPCAVTLPAGSGAYAQAPPLPLGFQCGVVRLSDWDGAGGVSPAAVRLVSVEIYTSCPGGAPGGPPFLVGHTGIAARVFPATAQSP